MQQVYALQGLCSFARTLAIAWNLLGGSLATFGYIRRERAHESAGLCDSQWLGNSTWIQPLLKGAQTFLSSELIYFFIA